MLILRRRSWSSELEPLEQLVDLLFRGESKPGGSSADHWWPWKAPTAAAWLASWPHWVDAYTNPHKIKNLMFDIYTYVWVGFCIKRLSLNVYIHEIEYEFDINYQNDKSIRG